MSMPMLARKSAANKLRIASTLNKRKYILDKNESSGENYGQLQRNTMQYTAAVPL
jgi:hypothetical protein